MYFPSILCKFASISIYCSYISAIDKTNQQDQYYIRLYLIKH
jgi:hypothetical protein